MKKQLLNESEVRKMMKFADIGPLAGTFVERLNELAEEEPVEDPMGMGAPDPSAGLGEPAPAEEEELELEPGAGEGEEQDVSSEALADVGNAIESLVGAFTKVATSDDPAATAQEVADSITLSDESGEQQGLAGEEDVATAELGGPGTEEDDDAGAGLEMVAEVELVDEEEVQEEMVNEVARRVARRLKLLEKRNSWL